MVSMASLQFPKYADQMHAQMRLSQPLVIRPIQSVVNVVEAAIAKAAKTKNKSARESGCSEDTVSYR